MQNNKFKLNVEFMDYVYGLFMDYVKLNGSLMNLYAETKTDEKCR